MSKKRGAQKILIDWFIYGIAIYLIVLGFLYLYQRNLMYFPGGEREPIEHITDVLPETITVHPEEDIELQGFYWPAQDPGKPTIVYFHGNAQAYEFWMDKLKVYVDQGYGAYFTDYRGYGGQPGTPTEEGIYQDARSFIKGLKGYSGLTDQDLVLYGESLGSGVAVQMATEFDAKALILESPYSATVDVAQDRYWIFPARFLMKDQFLSREKIDDLTMPKIFVHAQRDMVIPIKFATKLYERAAEPKEFHVIAKAGHNNLYDFGAQLHILEFLRTLDEDAAQAQKELY